MDLKKPSILSEFTNKYSLSKTLRFELIPQGKTLEFIEKKGLLKQDEKRAQEYKKVKKIIDNYHKKFIEDSLSKAHLIKLVDFAENYNKKEKDEKYLKELQKLLRKQIVELFKKNDKYKLLFEKELITEELPNFTNDEEEKKLINEFNKFTTYFKGFHENRKNMYSEEDKSTAIAYRIINENLPKFLDNLNIFEKIKEKINFEESIKHLLLGKKLSEVFSVEFFNSVLNQKGIEYYNNIIGGITEENRTKIKGINEYINEYNQKQKDKIPKLKQLYKQILSDTETASFVLDKFEEDNEVLETIQEYYESLKNYKYEGVNQNIFDLTQQLFLNIKSFDTSKIYIKNSQLSNISTELFGDWSIIRNALLILYENLGLLKKKKGMENPETSKKWQNKYFSLAEIENALSKYENEIVEKKYYPGIITDYFASLKKEDKNLIQQIENEYSNVKDLLNIEYPKTKNLISDKKNVEKIKAFLDALIELLHFFKMTNIKPDEMLEKDERFYSQYSPLFEQLDKIIPLYNKVRNYMTKKPYSIEKIKLNFENSTLLSGWDLNKETANTSIILRKNGLYYLGIMDKEHNKIFEKVPAIKNNEEYYEKMVYKLLPGPNKMLPKVFFSEKGKEKYNPSDELLKKYEEGTHKKGDNFNIKDCHKLIDFFKKSIKMNDDWKEFDFEFSDTSEYEDISGFYKEVENQGYKIIFQNIHETYINKIVDEGKLYLFQIYNKDFSPKSYGTPNMHTLYWKMLFDPQNLKNVVYKLNGEAEMFYRKASITKEITHPANILIKNKNDLNEKKESNFNYDLIKNKRFTVDKFQFHVPITLNFKSDSRSNINFEARAFLKNNPNINIIGIDRGERHLLYLSLIDQKGKILLQETLNKVINKYKNKEGKLQTIETDYHSLLDSKEKKRDESRKNWTLIENIKELKEGYLSQIVHYISKLMVEKNAILVMENLNMGFKRGRQKVEKQVYQKFEKMLIDKLNYLVFKDKKSTELGGLLNALQLTSKFESFPKIGFQSGFIFYVPAALTSKIDYKTGFVDFLKPYYENENKAKEFFSKFASINYNKEKDWFEFDFDYNKFTDKAQGSKLNWKVCSTNNKRYVYDKTLNAGKGAQKEINVCEELKKLFENAKINYLSGNSIKEEIINQKSADFFKKLMKLLSTLLSLRHNNGLKGDEEKDYILSSVAPFFNSLEAKKDEPKDADANGAYHIALKGLWMLKQINESEDLRKVKIAISNKEWLNFAQNKTF